MGPRRSAPIVAMVFVVLAVGVVLVLRQTAMFSDTSGPPHATTRLVVTVRYQDGRPARASDTRLLWLVCAVNVPGESINTEVDRGTITATLTPALGSEVQRRFVGCLQDLTLPGMLGTVTSTAVIPRTPTG